MDKVYIYALVDVRNQSIFYVGSTDNPVRRYNQYIKKKPHNPRLVEIISELKGVGRLPVMKIIDETDIYDRNPVEMYWIRKLYLEGQPLKNTTCIRNWKQ